MKRLVRVLALVLSVVMMVSSLTACDGDTLAVSDYANTVAATYGDEKIMMDEAAFFLRNQQVSMESYYWSFYTSYYGYSSLWEAPYDDNKDMDVYLKEVVMQQLRQTRILIDHASEYGLSEADVDNEACAEEACEIYESLDEAFFQYSDVTEAKLSEWLELNDLAYQVYEAAKEAQEITYTTEETEMYTIKYVTFEDEDEDEDETEEADEEETTAEADTRTAAEKAQDFYDAIVAGGDIDTLAEESDYTVSSSSYLKVDEDTTVVLHQNTMELATGESVMFEDSDKYYVAYCVSDSDEDATADKIESVTNTKKEEAFNELYITWQDASPAFEVTSAWENLEVSDGNKLIPDTTEAETEEETEAAEDTTAAEEETTEA